MFNLGHCGEQQKRRKLKNYLPFEQGNEPMDEELQMKGEGQLQQPFAFAYLCEFSFVQVDPTMFSLVLPTSCGSAGKEQLYKHHNISR